MSGPIPVSSRWRTGAPRSRRRWPTPEPDRAPSLYAVPDSRRRLWIGVGLIAVAVLCLSLTSVGAVKAFSAGADPFSVVTVRIVGAALLLFAMLRATGASMRLERRDLRVSAALALLLLFQSYAMYKSFERIPIGLTLTIFYVYPLVVALTESMTGGERVTPRVWVGLTVAFLGLVLVFNVTGAGLDAKGAAYALVSALGWAGMTAVGGRFVRGRDTRVFSMYLQSFAALVVAALCLANGGLKLPGTTVGWVGYFSVPVLYSIGFAAYLAAVGRLGAVRVSVIMNFEPVWTITLGWLALGQVLTGLQLFGAGLVVAAVAIARGGAARS